MTDKNINILIAGGGTGGHLFPGIAIAQSFMRKNPENKILFINAGRPFDKSVLSKTEFEYKQITSEGIKGRGIWQKMKSALKIPEGIWASIKIIKNFKPDLVVGVGGYSSGPVVIGAWLLNMPIVLHEQNILPGVTNRILSKFADRIYVSFEQSKEMFDAQKTCVTGNPIRKEIFDRVEKDVSEQKERLFTILILGGSQGAHSINMTIVDTLKHLENSETFFFIHQTGAQDEAMVKDSYMLNGVQGNVQPFFTNMPEQYENADLIICRAGATTVAEITAIGKGVIFIPFPHAADNHQVLNARTLAHTGAAEMLLESDLSGEKLADRINYFSENKDALTQMAEKSKQFGRPDAADKIVDDSYCFIREQDK